MAKRKPAAKKKAAPKKSVKLIFKIGQFIVYPAHGVGKVTGIERETIADFDIEVYMISFEQDKMTLRVPTDKAANSGMRPLANENVLKDAFTTIKGRARIKRTMWSRRAQEYESKINSGDLILLSECPKSSAISTAPTISPTSPIPNGSCMNVPLPAWCAKSPPFWT